jgi:hypothetical protein
MIEITDISGINWRINTANISAIENLEENLQCIHLVSSEQIYVALTKENLDNLINSV